MNTEVKKTSKFREILKLISTIISWTVFVLLIICAIFLIYYFIATKIYMKEGSGHEPKFSLYTIISPSMVPNIKVYDVVIDVKVDSPEDIQINDVITFTSNLPEVHGGTITHRVIAITKDEDGNYYYQTKGDSNLIEDSGQVAFTSIVGKVALKIPQLGRVQFFLASSYGWLILILIPALYIIFKDIFRIIKAKKGPVSAKPKSKFMEFMTRPLLPYNKKKLLTYTPQKESTPITNVIPQVNKAIFDFEDDEIDLDDLPSLK